MLNRIRKTAESNGDKIAYKIGSDSITYGQLWDKAERYAQFLKKQGTGPVAVYGHKSVEMIVSFLACLIAKRAYVPIDVNTPIYRIKQILNLSSSALVVANEPLEEVECITLGDLTRCKESVTRTNDNDTAYIMFTSGTTGVPKGVPISVENLNNFVDWIGNIPLLRSFKYAKVLNQANFAFDLSVADIFYSLCYGHTLVAFQDKENYAEMFSTIKDEKINVAIMTPTFLKFCLANVDFTEKNYPSFSCIYLCGERLEPKTVRKLFKVFPNIKVINAYGPTEATSAVTAIEITKEMCKNDKPLPVGKIDFSACDVVIIDGEIVLKGKSVFGGYVSGNDDSFYIENGINCYKTGDNGFVENGLIYCEGRKDSRIKYKGYRIEIGEIESSINAIEGVEDCAVVAKYDDAMTVKTIKAFVVSRNVNADNVKNILRKKLPEYMIPKTIKILETLPITHNGKINRKALSDL